MKRFNALYVGLMSLFVVFGVRGMDQSSLTQLPNENGLPAKISISIDPVERLRGLTEQYSKLEKSTELSDFNARNDVIKQMQALLKDPRAKIPNRLPNNQGFLNAIGNIVSNTYSVSISATDFYSLKQGLDIIHYSTHPLELCTQLTNNGWKMYDNITKEFNSKAIENTKNLLAIRKEINLNSQNSKDIDRVISDLQKKVAELSETSKASFKGKKYIVSEIETIIDTLCDASVNEPGKQFGIANIVQRIMDKKYITFNGKIGLLKLLVALPESMLPQRYKAYVKIQLIELQKAQQSAKESSSDVNIIEPEPASPLEADDLLQSAFYQPSEDELLLSISTITSNIVKNLKKLARGSKKTLKNLESIKQKIIAAIDAMYKQIKEVEKEIPSNSARLSELRLIQQKIKDISEDQIITQNKESNIFLQNAETIEKIEKITINKIKNKDIANDLGSSSLQLEALSPLAKQEKSQRKEERKPLLEKLKKEDLELKILKEIGTISDAYIKLVRQHIRTLEEYSVMITKYEPKLKRSIEYMIQKNIKNLDRMIVKMYKVLPYPSLDNTLLISRFFPQINLAIATNNQKKLTQVIDEFRKAYRPRELTNNINTPSELIAEAFFIRPDGLKKLIKDSLKYNNENNCKLIPFFLQEIYKYQLGHDDLSKELAQLAQHDLLSLLEGLHISHQWLSLRSPLINVIISDGLDPQKMQACLMLLNKMCTFYPKIKNDDIETSINLIASKAHRLLGKKPNAINLSTLIATTVNDLNALAQPITTNIESKEEKPENFEMINWEGFDTEVPQIPGNEEEEGSEKPVKIVPQETQSSGFSMINDKGLGKEIPQEIKPELTSTEPQISEINPPAISSSGLEWPTPSSAVIPEEPQIQPVVPVASTNQSTINVVEPLVSATIQKETPQIPRLARSSHELEETKRELKEQIEQTEKIKKSLINDLRQQENAEKYLESKKAELLQQISEDDYNELIPIARTIEQGKKEEKLLLSERMSSPMPSERMSSPMPSERMSSLKSKLKADYRKTARQLMAKDYSSSSLEDIRNSLNDMYFIKNNNEISELTFQLATAIKNLTEEYLKRLNLNENLTIPSNYFQELENTIISLDSIARNDEDDEIVNLYRNKLSQDIDVLINQIKNKRGIFQYLKNPNKIEEIVRKYLDDKSEILKPYLDKVLQAISDTKAIAAIEPVLTPILETSKQIVATPTVVTPIIAPAPAAEPTIPVITPKEGPSTPLTKKDLADTDIQVTEQTPPAPKPTAVEAQGLFTPVWNALNYVRSSISSAWNSLWHYLGYPGYIN